MTIGVISCLISVLCVGGMWSALNGGGTSGGIVLFIFAILSGAAGGERIYSRSKKRKPLKSKTKTGMRILLIVIFSMLSSVAFTTGDTEYQFPTFFKVLLTVLGFGIAYNIAYMMARSSEKRARKAANIAVSAYVSSPAPVQNYSMEVIKILFKNTVPSPLTPEMISVAVDSYDINQTRIFNDCVNLINTTKNAETFFSRLEMLETILTDGRTLENYGYRLPQLSPTVRIDAFKPQKGAIIDGFIDRSYSETMSQAQTLKTQSARDKRTEKYFNSVKKHEKQMFPQNIQHLNELEKAAAPDFSVDA